VGPVQAVTTVAACRVVGPNQTVTMTPRRHTDGATSGRPPRANSGCHGEYDYAPFFARLREIGYEKRISVRSVIQGFPQRSAPSDRPVAPRLRAITSSVWSRASGTVRCELTRLAPPHGAVQMNRRQFLVSSASGVAAASLGRLPAWAQVWTISASSSSIRRPIEIFPDDINCAQIRNPAASVAATSKPIADVPPRAEPRVLTCRSPRRNCHGRHQRRHSSTGRTSG
jgi:hypothetical protein